MNWGMEALQASALPLGYTTEKPNHTIAIEKKQPHTYNFVMKPIPFNTIAEILYTYHPMSHLVTGFAIDSRKIKRGDLFFALPGNRFDGHSFLRDAAEKGALGAIVREDFPTIGIDLPLIKVPDVLLALQDLARKIVQKRASKVIAITGSLGKTTTKEFISHLLKTHYKVFSSPLSYNSQSTVALSILMAEGDEDFLILEMGMTHPGNLKNLISIAPPEIALLTTIAVQHASNFEDGLEGISREKATIFSHPKTELGILHRDIISLDQVTATGRCRKKTFSLASPHADYFLERSKEGIIIHATGEKPILLHPNLPTQVHDHNLLAAVALARSLDLPWKAICEVVPHLKLPPMRFEKVEKQGILFINDAYNANPDSIIGALETLPPPSSGGKVIAVLSEMDALGAYSEEGHARVGTKALSHTDYLLCIGPRCHVMREIWEQGGKPVEHVDSHSHLEAALKRIAKPGDVVLLKGARAYALDQLLNLF